MNEEENKGGCLVAIIVLYDVSSSFYCQSDIEDNGICDEQCEHCKEYYKPLENES